jgi:hypothetical protein
MARLHGRRGRIYLGVASDSAEASPIPFFSSWTVNWNTEKAEVTAFGDENKIYVAGLPDAGGSFAGFYDDATMQTYTAATDGLARKFYLYPDATTNTKYFFGTILPDFSVDGSVSDAVKVSVSWQPASTIARVPAS